MSTAPTIAFSSHPAALLRSYRARNADGASRSAIDSVGHASMQKTACSTNTKKAGDGTGSVMMR